PRESLLGGRAVPEHSLVIAALDARAALVREPQSLLCRRESLLRRPAPPGHGRGVVPFHAQPRLGPAAQTRLRPPPPPFCRASPAPRRLACAAASPCSAGGCHHWIASASSRATPRPPLSRPPRPCCALGSPASAALRYHSAACAKSCSTPAPRS